MTRIRMRFKISPTLFAYLGRTYLRNLLAMTAILLSIIYLFDTVELLRRASDKDITLPHILLMGLFKLPDVGQIILPFAILFSAIFTFWQLTHRQELVVVRSAGFSVWQFLGPVLIVSILVSFFNLALINPVGAMLLGKFERFENEMLSNRKSYVTLLKEGLWLRQDRPDGQVILHSESIDLPDWRLRNVMVLFFDPEDDFIRRIDAGSARIEKGEWVFSGVTRNAPGLETQKLETATLPTDLTTQELEESFSSPETMSLWALPDFIQTMEATGFDATNLRIHFQSLLAQPLLFAAMVLLAATVSLRPPRLRGAFGFIALGMGIGFVVFFVTSFLKALGASHQIPVMLAAWAPPLITALLGIAVILNQEDG